MDLEIERVLCDVGISPGDWILIHGDAGVAAQMTKIDVNKRLNTLIERIVNYIHEGTILVPAFSYSFTKGEDFNVNETPSDVGLFSEAFRKFPGVIRTRHPIFSFSVLGSGVQMALDANLNDCFGKQTIFDMLYKMNIKIVCLGNNFSKGVTHAHYVEQSLGVEYRYFKYFKGKLIDNNVCKELETRYFVRKHNIKSSCDLNLMKYHALKKGLLREGELGRYPISSISAVDFYNLAKELYISSKYALVEEGRELLQSNILK